eukprot:29026-Pelagococcus_subviridis.AAC.11
MSLKYATKQIAKNSIAMMPYRSNLFAAARRPIAARIFLLLAMLSSAPCTFSLALLIVSRCRCRSCRMLTPSSSVSSSDFFPSRMRSPVLSSRAVDCSMRSRCDDDVGAPMSSSSAPASSCDRAFDELIARAATWLSRFSRWSSDL